MDACERPGLIILPTLPPALSTALALTLEAEPGVDCRERADAADTAAAASLSACSR